MADPKGFLTTPRVTPARRPVSVRISDWREVYTEFGTARLELQAGRCMDCGIPFCHQGCPLGNLIPEWNDLVWREDWEEAARRLHATNNFPEFTGRLCPAPCESACVLGINSDPVTIKQVEVEIADRALASGWAAPEPPATLTGRTVAVVGSGPAGLAAAQQLTRAGHTVTVYERAEAPGGLLRFGIPEFKLEKRHLDRRLDQMRAEGTTFACGIDVGRDVTAAQLRAEHDAVVLAGGATIARGLPVPGADCLGTVHRQGAASVTQLEIMPRPPGQRPDAHPWPTYPMIYRVSSAHEEGGERVFSVSTQAFLGDDLGRVRALRLVEVEGPAGRFAPVPGTGRGLRADLVLLAMGFTGADRAGLLDDLGVDMDARGNVARDGGYATSVPGVFVAGDMGRGQSLIVWAIAEGRSAAAAVDAYLMGSSALPAPIPPTARPLA